MYYRYVHIFNISININAFFTPFLRILGNVILMEMIVAFLFFLSLASLYTLDKKNYLKIITFSEKVI